MTRNEARAIVDEAFQFIVQYTDVEDGEEGPRPNKAMRICTELDMVLYWLEQPNE